MSDEEEGQLQGGEDADGEAEDDDDASEGLTIGGGTGENTPARKEESWLA